MMTYIIEVQNSLIFNSVNFTIFGLLAKFNSLYSGVRNTLDQSETSGEVQYIKSMELNVVQHPNNFYNFHDLMPFYVFGNC